MADVGCAGILVADTFCGPMPRLPNEGELLAVGKMPSKAGGCAANVAIDLARQGLGVDVAGCLGADASAKLLVSCLAAGGVGCGQVTYTDHYPTSQTVILLVQGQDRRYVHSFGANQAFTLENLSRDWLGGLRLFYLGGLCAMPGVTAEALAEVLRFCRGRGIITVVDVVIPQQFAGIDELVGLLPLIDYFLPNHDEAELLTGRGDPKDQLAALRALGVGTAVITLGKDGALAGRGDEYWSCGSYPVKALDPSGSGDAFAAGLITGVLSGWDMPETLRYASALGASATQAIGTTDGVFGPAAARSFIAAHPLDVSHGKRYDVLAV